MYLVTLSKSKVNPLLYEQSLEKTEGAIKNGQSRETANIGYTRQTTKTHTTKITTQKTKEMSNTHPTIGVNLLSENWLGILNMLQVSSKLLRMQVLK